MAIWLGQWAPLGIGGHPVYAPPQHGFEKQDHIDLVVVRGDDAALGGLDAKPFDDLSHEDFLSQLNQVFAEFLAKKIDSS